MISRREFIGGVAAAGWTARNPQSRPQSAIRNPQLRVDARVLRARIEALSLFGRPAGGSFADGVSRTAYSDADVAGRAYVMGQMRAASLPPRIDPAGNIFARREGASPALPPILFGSHIDSVPNGGNFDGDGIAVRARRARGRRAVGLDVVRRLPRPHRRHARRSSRG